MCDTRRGFACPEDNAPKHDVRVLENCTYVQETGRENVPQVVWILRMMYTLRAIVVLWLVADSRIHVKLMSRATRTRVMHNINSSTNYVLLNGVLIYVALLSVNEMGGG